MSDLAASLPSYFGLPGISKKERGAFLAEAKGCLYKIHKTAESPKGIYARYNLLNRLAEAGFAQTDALIPAANGVPFVTLGRDTFVMTRFYRGNEPDMNNAQDVAAMLEGMARFHLAARGILAEIPAAQPACEVFEKQRTALNIMVKQVNRKPRLSDFDVLMLKNADKYAALASEAADILAGTGYLKLYQGAVDGKHICHNGLKEETFVLGVAGAGAGVGAGGENFCAITRFDEAAFDLQLADIAAILRRYARKSSHEMPVGRLLEIYSKIAPLPEGCEKILRALLVFPWPFLKIVSLFYSKKRNFTPAAITSRMEEILNEQERYNSYIKGPGTGR